MAVWCQILQTNIASGWASHYTGESTCRTLSVGVVDARTMISYLGPRGDSLGTSSLYLAVQGYDVYLLLWWIHVMFYICVNTFRWVYTFYRQSTCLIIVLILHGWGTTTLISWCHCLSVSIPVCITDTVTARDTGNWCQCQLVSLSISVNASWCHCLSVSMRVSVTVYRCQNQCNYLSMSVSLSVGVIVYRC